MNESHMRNYLVGYTGVEPASSAWKTDMLPLHQYLMWPRLRESNPHLRRDSPESSPLEQDGVWRLLRDSNPCPRIDSPASSPLRPRHHMVMPAGFEPALSDRKSDVLTPRRRHRILFSKGIIQEKSPAVVALKVTIPILSNGACSSFVFLFYRRSFSSSWKISCELLFLICKNGFKELFGFWETANS